MRNVLANCDSSSVVTHINVHFELSKVVVGIQPMKFRTFFVEIGIGNRIGHWIFQINLNTHFKLG